MRSPESLLEIQARKPIVIKDPEFSRLGKSSTNACFEVPRDRVVRIPYSRGKQSVSANSVLVQWALWYGTIAVPKPYRMVPVLCWDENLTGLEMRKIMGATLDDMGDPEDLLTRGRAEMERARQMGFVVGDGNYGHNIMYNPPLDKVFLIDFDSWELPKDHPYAKFLATSSASTSP